ncbi:MAG: hypothetical protein UU47_C0004G0026 [candidate division TM6 bacterium GW2011_GWE2_41_16]|nr:MAG: hypothetical protein UU47_C0004G0026 [candidate division TM6 bacterium GW2011_GWE2_41_16]
MFSIKKETIMMKKLALSALCICMITTPAAQAFETSSFFATTRRMGDALVSFTQNHPRQALAIGILGLGALICFDILTRMKKTNAVKTNNKLKESILKLPNAHFHFNEEATLLIFGS